MASSLFSPPALRLFTHAYEPVAPRTPALLRNHLSRFPLAGTQTPHAQSLLCVPLMSGGWCRAELRPVCRIVHAMDYQPRHHWQNADRSPSGANIYHPPSGSAELEAPGTQLTSPQPPACTSWGAPQVLLGVPAPPPHRPRRCLCIGPCTLFSCPV